MKFSWHLDNIKCGGCAKRIRHQLMTLPDVSDVHVSIDEGIVSVEASLEQEASILAKLKRLGYPLTGTTSGLSSTEADIRSVISCALGRLDLSKD